MRLHLVILVNRVLDEFPRSSNVRIGRIATARGHRVSFVDVASLSLQPDNFLYAASANVPCATYDTDQDFFDALIGVEKKRVYQRIDSADFLWIRTDPENFSDQPWRQNAPIMFGQLAKAAGMPVVNDPARLGDAVNKLYFQLFPESVRPRSLISRDPEKIREFVATEGVAILKPLQGAGGKSVFIAKWKHRANLNQMIEAINESGYCIAQEFLPDAKNGDIRLLVMNGEPLRCGDQIAAFRRVAGGKDIRNNINAGGQAVAVEYTAQMRAIVKAIQSKLNTDGMFFVGLDVVGEKLLEINVFNPGGLQCAEETNGIDFTPAVIDAIEEKCEKNLSARWHEPPATGA